MAETRLQEWKTSKLPFLGHPLCSWLHFCAYFSSSWSCGHQGLGAPLWKLILAAGREIAGRFDLSRGFVGLQHCHTPISSPTPRSTSPWRHADGQQTLLSSPTSPQPPGPPPPSPTSSPPLWAWGPSLQCPSCRACEGQWESWGNFRDMALQELFNHCMTYTNEQRDKKMLFLALLCVIFSFNYKSK